MTPATFINVAWAPAMTLLPQRMDTAEAKALVLAICLQESRLVHRRQIGGPARGFAQFEHGGGVRGVLSHPASRDHIRAVLDALEYDHSPDTSYAAIEHNDVLACCFARLLLWTLPDALPVRGESDEAWDQYISAWRPGRPHRHTWNALYEQAWAESRG